MAENQSGLGIKGNGGGRPMSTEEVERELEDTRREMRETLDAILGRALPSSALWRQMRENLGNPGEFAANLGATVQRNPLPATVATIGLAWLIWSDSTRPARVRENGTRATERLEEVRERLGSSAAEGRERMRSSAELWAIRARRTGSDFGDYAQRLLREQPLVTGMVALAAGALIGAALPRTRVEAERFGPVRDRAAEAMARPEEGTAEAPAKSEAEAETAERTKKTKGRGKGRRRH